MPWSDVRLAAYLTYWQNWILENEMFGVYHQGVKWNEETREIIKRRGSPQEALKLQEEKKKLINEIKEKIEKGEVELDREKLVRDIQQLPKETIGSILESTKTIKQNLIDGKTFISDDEAAVLGVAVANQAIELKMGLLDLFASGTMLIIWVVSSPAEFEIKNYSTHISQMVWRGVLVSKNIDLLARAARAISSKSVLALTLQNIRHGSRLTKR